MLNWLKLLRVNQYIKNLFILIPAFFGGHFFVASSLMELTFLFIAFCGTSSTVYILNDILDREADRNHPTKKNRPIAKGTITITQGLAGAVILLVTSLALAWLTLNGLTVACLATYLALNIFYVLLAKNQAILDVFCLALGFVIRVQAGVWAIGTIVVSQWLMIMVFLLSVFLALGKRWHDLSLMLQDPGRAQVRKSLAGYNREYLLVLMTFFATINTICYIIYAIMVSNGPLGQSQYFFATSLWVILGHMRYLQIIFVQHDSHSPTQTLFYDRFMQLTVLGWIIHTTLELYR